MITEPEADHYVLHDFPALFAQRKSHLIQFKLPALSQAHNSVQ